MVKEEHVVLDRRRSWRAILILATLITASCSRDAAAPDDVLRSRIAAMVAKGDGTIIRIADLTDFKWDRMHVFGPYTSVSESDQALGFHWPTAARTDIERIDWFTLLVFVKDDAVCAYVEHPRGEGDFAFLEGAGGFSPTTTVFVVRSEPPNRSHKVIRELAETDR